MKAFRMSCVLLFVLSSSLLAEDRGKLIFEDDFERNESQEEKEELSNGWGSNSKSRAKGNKQVNLKDGAMFIKTHPAADHATSVTHEAAFRDGTIELRFLLEDEQDTLGLDFADLKFKEVHAGHLFKVDVGTKFMQINDMKTGTMNLTFYDARKAGKLTDAQKTFLKTTTKRFPAKLDAGKWHTLVVAIAGETVAVTIDGKEAGTFTSAGFAHPTKRLLRLAVPRSAVVDDIKIFATDR